MSELINNENEFENNNQQQNISNYSKDFENSSTSLDKTKNKTDTPKKAKNKKKHHKKTVKKAFKKAKTKNFSLTDDIKEIKNNVKPPIKKNIFIILVSLAIFIFTLAGEFMYTNFLIQEDNTQIVSWMFVTGESDSIVKKAETYNQAESNNKISKPWLDKYVHCIYTAKGANNPRLLKIITEYSPIKVIINEQEVYNNGYGKVEIAGNSYNEIILPESEDSQVIELYIYYPFSFNLKANITELENTSAFDFSYFIDNLAVNTGIVITVIGIIMLISIIFFMFRSRDVIVLSGIGAVTVLSGIVLFLKEMSDHSDLITSPLIFSAINTILAVIICIVIINLHSLLNYKKKVSLISAFAIPAVSLLVWVQNITFIRIGLLLIALAAIVAVILLYKEMFNGKNMVVKHHTPIKIAGEYFIFAFVFNCLSTATGLWRFSVTLFVLSVMVYCIMLYFVYAREVAEKKLIKYSNEKKVDDYNNFFKTVSNLVMGLNEETSLQNFVINFCRKISDFLIKSEILLYPRQLNCRGAVWENGEFTEVYNSSNLKDGFDYISIANNLSQKDNKFTVGSSFIELMIGEKDNQAVIVFNNTYSLPECGLSSFVYFIYSLLAVSYKSLNARYKMECNLENVFIKLAVLAEEKSHGTKAHLIAVSKMTKVLAENMGFKKLAPTISTASRLHNIGKISISTEILDKSTPLTPQEQEIIRRHVITGYNILSGINGEFFDIARNITLEHHENFDGTGYLGMKGKEISIYARIVRVADVFDALVSKRRYKDKWSYEDAITYIAERKGTEFDPDVVNSFISCGMKLIEIKENEITSD